MSKKSNEEEFDYTAFEADAIKRLMNGESFGGKDGILKPLIQRLLQAGLEGEMEGHLAEDPKPNRRNGRGRKMGCSGAYDGERCWMSPFSLPSPQEPEVKIRKRHCIAYLQPSLWLNY